MNSTVNPNTANPCRHERLLALQPLIAARHQIAESLPCNITQVCRLLNGRNTYRIAEESESRLVNFRHGGKDHTKETLSEQCRHALNQRNTTERVAPLLWRAELGQQSLSGRRRA